MAHCLAIGRKVVGMRHLEYRVVDPRSRMIRAFAQQVARQPEHVKLLDVLSAVDEAFIEQTREKRRTLRANLEFYKGVAYLALGVPFFTARFAACDGTATGPPHIRPAAHYVGPAPREIV